MGWIKLKRGIDFVFSVLIIVYICSVYFFIMSDLVNNRDVDSYSQFSVYLKSLPVAAVCFEDCVFKRKFRISDSDKAGQTRKKV